MYVCRTTITQNIKNNLHLYSLLNPCSKLKTPNFKPGVIIYFYLLTSSFYFLLLLFTFYFLLLLFTFYFLLFTFYFYLLTSSFYFLLFTFYFLLFTFSCTSLLLQALLFLVHRASTKQQGLVHSAWVHRHCIFCGWEHPNNRTLLFECGR